MERRRAPDTGCRGHALDRNDPGAEVWERVEHELNDPAKVRREVTDDQSIAWMSTFMPMSRQALPTTSENAFEIGMSVGCRMTTFSPL